MSAAAHLSSLQLDALALGAMEPVLAAAARAHLASCARCRADDSTAAAARAHFTAALLPQTMGAVRRRADASQRARRAWLPGLLLAFGAATALLFWARPAPVEDDLLAKSAGPSVTAYYRRGDRVAPVAAGERLRRGDAVRLTVIPAARRFVAVLSLDGAGHVTRWFPLDAAESRALPAGRTELPGSIVLDASPGPERLFAFFSSAPLPLAVLEARLAGLARTGPEAARSAVPLAPEATDQVVLPLEKAAE